MKSEMKPLLSLGEWFSKLLQLKSSRFKVHLILYSTRQGCKTKFKLRCLHATRENLVFMVECWGVKSRTAWVKKLRCCLVVQQQILLYLLSDGSRVNRPLLLDWVLSFSISCHQHHWSSVDGTSDVLGPLMVRAFVSFATFLVRMLSIAPLMLF